MIQWRPAPYSLQGGGPQIRYLTMVTPVYKKHAGNVWRNVFCWSMKDSLETSFSLKFLHVCLFFKKKLKIRQMTICINPLAFSKFTNLRSRFRPQTAQTARQRPEAFFGVPKSERHVTFRGLCSVLGAVCTWWCSQLDGFQASDTRGGRRGPKPLGFAGDDEILPGYVGIIFINHEIRIPTKTTRIQLVRGFISWLDWFGGP